MIFSEATDTASSAPGTSAIPRVELMWPGKDEQIAFSGSTWTFSPMDGAETRRSLRYKETIGGEGGVLHGWVVAGDYISALDTLIPLAGGSVQMAYFDSPRLSVLETEAAPGYAVSTWLSIVQQAAIKSSKSLKRTGFFLLHADEETAHYGRQVLDEVFGRLRHVTTFAWQKKYAPQNDKNKNNPTDAFDYIIVYSKCPLEDLPKIGLLQTPDSIIDDGDWRGCYTAGHKGAKSGSEVTKFHVNAPPYRWKMLDASLPEGRHWFDGLTGVLWFESIESAGDYWVKVQCTDATGNVDEKTVHFSTRESASLKDHFNLPDRIWWLLKNDNDISPSGRLAIAEEDGLEGIVGDEYSMVFKATGGTPFTMKSSAPGRGRYWEFSLRTLVESIAETTASFGVKGVALPSKKTFHDRNDTQVRTAVMNWLPWYDYGKSEDASRHVNALVRAGITSGTPNLTAKPQQLLAHLVSLFAPNECDIVLALGDMNAVTASVAMKMNRRFIHITGGSERDREAWENTASKRLVAVMAGLDSGETEKDDPMPGPYAVKAGIIDVLCVSRREMRIDKTSGAVHITEAEGEDMAGFYAGLAGAYRREAGSDAYHGLQGQCVVVLDEEEILDAGMLSYLASQHAGQQITVIAERLELPIGVPLPQNVTVVHAPFDLEAR